MARSRIRSRQPVSTLASLVAQAAAESHVSHGAALHDAVIAFATLARQSVLKNGVVIGDDVRAAVDAIAATHLGRAAADRALSQSCQKVADRQLRNAIEVAHGQVLDLGELAHYYAGLMAGLALRDVTRSTLDR